MPMNRFESAILIICATVWTCAFGAQQTLAQSLQADKQAPQTNKQTPEKLSANRATIDSKKFALIISGVGGEEIYAKKFTAQAMQLYDALTNKLGFDEKRVHLLTENVISNSENMAN